MEHQDKTLAIQFIRPNAEFTLVGDDLIWLDQEQKEPTKSEIEKGWAAYQKAITINSEEKSLAKTALLEKLGITEDEAKLLLG